MARGDLVTGVSFTPAQFKAMAREFFQNAGHKDVLAVLENGIREYGRRPHRDVKTLRRHVEKLKEVPTLTDEEL
jgi:hypothetical protein